MNVEYFLHRKDSLNQKYAKFSYRLRSIIINVDGVRQSAADVDPGIRRSQGSYQSVSLSLSGDSGRCRCLRLCTASFYDHILDISLRSQKLFPKGLVPWGFYFCHLISLYMLQISTFMTKKKEIKPQYAISSKLYGVESSKSKRCKFAISEPCYDGQENFVRLQQELRYPGYNHTVTDREGVRKFLSGIEQNEGVMKTRRRLNIW